MSGSVGGGSEISVGEGSGRVPEKVRKIPESEVVSEEEEEDGPREFERRVKFAD